jgi:hypothetical protein
MRQDPALALADWTEAKLIACGCLRWEAAASFAAWTPIPKIVLQTRFLIVRNLEGVQ